MTAPLLPAPICNCGVSKGIRSDHEGECAATYLHTASLGQVGLPNSNKPYPRRVFEMALRKEGRLGLDPEVLAQLRRDEGDAAQLDWDSTRLAPDMLTALVRERGADPAILLPPAKFIETMQRLLCERGGQLDPMILTGTLRSVTRKLVQAKFYDACLFLQHAWGGIRAEGTADELMSDAVRHFFPVAPRGWLETGPKYGPSLLSRALPTWRMLNPPRE